MAPKGAGSSPVGHPHRFRISKPNTRNKRESRRNDQDNLTPLKCDQQVWESNQEPENRRRTTVTVEVRPFTVWKAQFSVGGGEDDQNQKEKRHHVTGGAPVALFACMGGSRFACEGRRDP